MSSFKYTRENIEEIREYKIYSYFKKKVQKIRINYHGIFLFLLIGIVFGYMHWPSIFVPMPIRVEYLKKTLRACEGSDLNSAYNELQRACYMKVFVDMVRQYGLPHAAATLRAYMHTPGGQHLAGQRCHAIAHEIGNVSARIGVSAPVVMTQCADMCNTYSGSVPFDGLDAGCLNGAAHTWVLLSPRDELPIEKCNDPNASQSAKEGCFHGIGHGLFEKYQGDIEKAIEQCKTLPSSSGQYQCAHAIFMEPYAVLHEIDLLSFCRSLPISMQDSCFEFSGFMMFNRTKNIKRALDTCRDTTVRTMDCALRVGESLYAWHHIVPDIRLCIGFENSEGYKYCIAGFVRASMYHVQDNYGQFAVSACNQLSGEHALFCFGTVGKYMQEFYGPVKRRATCSKVGSADGVKACEVGVEL